MHQGVVYIKKSAFCNSLPCRFFSKKFHGLHIE